jgi:RNA polymerase sigma factor (sigma-70 family)
MTTTEVTATTGAASNPESPTPAGRPDHGAAGTLVAKLFTDHGRMVLGLCRLLLRDPVEAEDAAQQVFLSAHSAVLRGSPPREEQAWLAAIARNECRARIHARMRESLALPDLPSDLPDPLAAAIRATDLEAIWAAISSLPRRQRNALVLREVGGLSYHELGRALGVSQSSVESLLFRARRQVRGLVAAATPLALRDDLARLIPGFDPASAGLAARVVSLPVAVKLATAAVSVGVVTTGAAQFPEHHPRTQPNSQATGSLTRSGPVEPASTVLVTRRRAPARHEPAVQGRRRDNSDRSGERGHEHAERAEPAEQEHESAQTEAGHDGSERVGSDTSGSDHSGSGSSGSDHSGPSGGDSLPDGVDD